MTARIFASTERREIAVAPQSSTKINVAPGNVVTVEAVNRTTEVKVKTSAPIVLGVKTVGMQGPAGPGTTISTNLVLTFEGALIS